LSGPSFLAFENWRADHPKKAFDEQVCEYFQVGKTEVSPHLNHLMNAYVATRDAFRDSPLPSYRDKTDMDLLLARNWNDPATVTAMNEVLMQYSSLHMYSLGRKDEAKLYLHTRPVPYVPHAAPQNLRPELHPDHSEDSPILLAKENLEALRAKSISDNLSPASPQSMSHGFISSTWSLP
jgi:hypothetical protein